MLEQPLFVAGEGLVAVGWGDWLERVNQARRFRLGAVFLLLYACKFSVQEDEKKRGRISREVAIFYRKKQQVSFKTK